MSQPTIRRAAVLGAGVMGAQIAAHLAAARIQTDLFDLPSKEGDPNALIHQAIKGLTKLKPAPLATPEVTRQLVACNYDEDLERLRDCDLVIEAIAERMDWKRELYDKVAPHLSEDALFATNTSGLSINSLAEVLPKELRKRFCGVHFFNPPRYMHLAELIPGADTDASVLDGLEEFLTSTLGKGVVRAKDTPNFIGNRVGVFSMLAGMHHTQAFGLGFDQVDAMTGPAIGRPKSATYRTADVVGLDTMIHVIGTMADQLPEDPWHEYFSAPGWLQGLVDKGAKGQKSGAGVYRKEGKTIRVLDLEQGDYRDSGKPVDPAVQEILALRDPGKKMQALRESEAPEAQFLWACFRDLFHYCAVHLAEIADSVREVDQAMRWGYGWSQGPFESWQACGWKQVAAWIREDIDAGKTMASKPLPAWVDELDEGVYRGATAWSPVRKDFIGRPDLPVYRRQWYPDPMLGERFDDGKTLFENEGVRLWQREDDVGILSFKSKMNSLGPDVIEGAHQAIDLAESSLSGLIIWQSREPFCVGADLKAAAGSLESGGTEALSQMVERFQGLAQRLRYSMIPTVAAVRGMALGGGCEVLMHCDRTVAALESYIGLVEIGVGLLPAGGGLKELAMRAWHDARGTDAFPRLQQYFQAVAMAKVAGSALEAKQMGLLRPDDVVIFHSHELLHVAHYQVRALAEAGYRPPLPADHIQVEGDVGVANLKTMMVNMLEGNFISEHDMEIGSRIAEVLCGGLVERGSEVDENWLLRLEREHFVALAQMDKTRERIEHMLKTGKPKRN